MIKGISVGECWIVNNILKLSNIDYHTLLVAETTLIKELNDGGMGSFEFIKNSPGDRVFGSAILEAITYDIDGRKVMLELSIDNDGDLYQLDSFTEDFEPLKAPLGTIKKLDNINALLIIN